MTEPQKTAVMDDPWEDLVVSILSVNQYSLDKTYRGLAGLRKQGLCDPHNLIQWDQSEVVKRLRAGGLDRGEFMTNLFALRLAHLGEYIRQHGVAACTKVIAGTDAGEIGRFLSPVNGIGPKVIANFLLLRGYS